MSKRTKYVEIKLFDEHFKSLWWLFILEFLNIYIDILSKMVLF